MSGKYLIDTNIVIALFNGDPDISDWLRVAGEVHLCTVVIGELYYGAYTSTKRKENLAKLEEFVISSSILEPDITTAREYGIIKSDLRKKGSPIPENDIWIAALAKQYGLLLYTGDGHFRNIPGVNAVIRKIR